MGGMLKNFGSGHKVSDDPTANFANERMSRILRTKIKEIRATSYFSSSISGIRVESLYGREFCTKYVMTKISKNDNYLVISPDCVIQFS
jgi:hypothetical protein